VLRIGDVADAIGSTQRAIRYYEECGPLKPASRRSGANRRYDDDDRERLRLIKRLREDVGLSLAEIRTYLEVAGRRRVLKSEYAAADDPTAQLAVLDRAEPVVRRRVALLDRKLALVAALRAEDLARLERTVPPQQRGTASGINTMVTNTGQMLSISIAFPLVLSRIPEEVMFKVFLYGGGMGDVPEALHAFEDGLHQAFLVRSGLR
jgi:DNA-binding transcriptional MerR regulator